MPYGVRSISPFFWGQKNGGRIFHPPPIRHCSYSTMSTVTRIYLAFDAISADNTKSFAVMRRSFFISTNAHPCLVPTPTRWNIRVSEIPIVSKCSMDSVSISVVPHTGHRSASFEMISVVHFRFLHFITYRIFLTPPRAR